MKQMNKKMLLRASKLVKKTKPKIQSYKKEMRYKK